MNNENTSASELIKLRIIDYNGNEQICNCDTVKLECKYDKSDRNGGGLGIKKGHTKAVISLSKHNVKALLHGEEIFKSDELSGIAKVENNIVLILKD
ncbi:MAG: hypothetical protein PHE51_00650 [Eubacteriales bacterium]|nr:hypothetical protein [Eubacteriales bacterium]